MKGFLALFGMRGKGAVSEPVFLWQVGDVDDPPGAGRIADRKGNDQRERQARSNRFTGDDPEAGASLRPPVPQRGGEPCEGGFVECAQVGLPVVVPYPGGIVPAVAPTSR